jgi:hypothetical protein
MMAIKRVFCVQRRATLIDGISKGYGLDIHIADRHMLDMLDVGHVGESIYKVPFSTYRPSCFDIRQWPDILPQHERYPKNRSSGGIGGRYRSVSGLGGDGK